MIAMDAKNSKPKNFYQPLMYLYGERYYGLYNLDRIATRLCRLMGNGLLVSLDYESWKPKREVFEPVFTKK